MSDKPTWARRITEEREARSWNKPQFIAALRAHAPSELPAKDSLLRRVHAWESGSSCPDDFYKPIIAHAFGTVTAAIWPVTAHRDADSELVAGTGMDTLEIVTRLRSTSLDDATLDALRITVDRLCSEYPYIPADQLLVEGKAWLRRMITLLDGKLTLTQHREILATAGWLAALVGCVEYDTTNRTAAEATRKAAWNLGEAMTTPTRSTTAGRAYLDLRRNARQDHRPVDELIQLHVLECFLARLLSTARPRFHVDVSVGDPIIPAPAEITFPRVLGGQITIRSYPLAMIYAEKIVTAVSRGTTSTRWRDYADIYLLSRRHPSDGTELCTAIREVARHRATPPAPLSQALTGYAAIGQQRWDAWRRRQHLDDRLPPPFSDVIEAVIAFADPAITGTATTQRWNPAAFRLEYDRRRLGAAAAHNLNHTMERLVPAMVAHPDVPLSELPGWPPRRIVDQPAADPQPAGELLARLWCEVLGVDEARSEDNFFELGGNSLLATRLVIGLRSALGRKVPVRLVFDTDSFAELRQRLQLDVNRQLAVDNEYRT